MPIPVIPLALGAGAMYALNEQEKAKKEAEEAAKGPLSFLTNFASGIPKAAGTVSKGGLHFLQNLFGPSESSVQSDWVEDTANSPAQQSGAFTNDQLWQQKLKHEQWKKDQGRNYNKDYERYF